MTAATTTLSMDDNMGLGTPNFFSSAWNPEQNEFSFTEAFAGNHSGYTPQLLQGQVENNQLDYFSGQAHSQFSTQSMYQPQQSSAFVTSHDDLDRILGSAGTSILSKNIDIMNTVPMDSRLNQNAQVEGLTAYRNQLFEVPSLGGLPSNNWTVDTKPTAQRARIITQMNKDSGRRTSLRYGQITPVDSPPDDSANVTQKNSSQSPAKSKGDESVHAIELHKVKKPRKSKKKQMTKEQEESKRKKFLERNRVAADKCRQNRKKWIDDLQAKAHHFGADNTAKRAQLEELEQEIVQMRSLIFIHSRSCNEKDIANWVDQEASKVQLLGEPDSKAAVKDEISAIGQKIEEASSPFSRPTSSQGGGSFSDAISRRYSNATSDDFASAMSAQSSRRPSINQ